jgi:hypothetical protein
VLTRLSRPRTALALLLALAVCGAGCRGKPEPAQATVPAMRFAGVDLEYALERITTEAGWILGLDEISPADQSPDLALVRVDIDIPAGSLDSALRRLREAFGSFDYSLENGVVYVRSNMLVDTKTSLDVPLLEGGHFHGELVDLVKYIMVGHPSSYISVQQVQGGFAGPPVDLEIPANASVRDALLLYARVAKAGWVIRRGGQLTHDAKGNPAIIGTSIEPRGPRKGTSRLPRVYNLLSGAAALADASARLKTPFLVYDRTVLQDVRGILNLALQSDPKLPLKETLDGLAESGFGPGSWHFHWREEDGVPVVRTNHFLFYLRGRDFITAPLLAGEFEGSLPELARWINTHQKSPNGEVLMGGEIAPGMPTGKIRIEPGETVNDALVAFAKASGVSPYVIVLDMLNPFSGALIDHPHSWRGAYLQDLSEWRSHPEDVRVTGVIPDAPETSKQDEAK